jgi:hypothetical protein
MKAMKLILGCLVCTSVSAWAIEPGPSNATQKVTENWLQLQSSRQLASTNPQPASATERNLAMQRWLESYQHKIPEYYDDSTSGKIGK